MLIHMGWVGGEPSADVLAAVERTRRASPRCEVMFHADESMVPDKWLAISRALRPQMRSDVQRHAILRRYGGLWLDVDVRVLRDPAEWTAEWDRYTTVRVAHGPGTIGTDMIFIPLGWAGWPIIEAYIDEIIQQIATTRRVGVFALAGRMIEACQRQTPELFTILEPGTRFTFEPAKFSTDSVVARGFDPASHPLPPRPGLGDMVAAGLSAIGITEARAQAIASAVGIKDCGCGKRKAAMNRAGTLLGLPPGSTASG